MNTSWIHMGSPLMLHVEVWQVHISPFHRRLPTLIPRHMGEREPIIQYNPLSISPEKVKPIVGNGAQRITPSESSSLIMKYDEKHIYYGVIITNLLWVLWLFRSNTILQKQKWSITPNTRACSVVKWKIITDFWQQYL